MKRNLILAFAVFAFAILVAGCGGANTADIDAMQYGNAPELGSIVKNYKVAMRNQDWGAVYDMLPKKQHESWEDNLKKMKEKHEEIEKEYEKAVKDMEEKIEKETDDTQKGYYEMALKWTKEQKAALDGIETARDIYIYFKTVNPEIVVGEKIDGNDGYIIYLNLSTGETREKKELVKEDDQWKYTGGYWD